MEIQFDISKIESYSRALAEKLCNEFFIHSEGIKGEQILKFTSIEQINMFVIKSLLEKWREESVKLKSPYFNYDNPEVKDALQQLQNKLSQNILIRREFFKPLVEKAIFDTLYLIMKPEGYFSNEYSNKTEVKISEIKDSEKYFRINKSLIQEIINYADRDRRATMKGYELTQLADQIVKSNSITGNEKEQYLEKFSALLKLDIQTVSKPPVQNEERIIQKLERVDTPVVEGKKETVILNEKFIGKQLTVNDVLKTNQSGTLADKIGKSRIENIRGAISLSQKFLFINSLFKGVNTEYENALSDIDKCSNYDEALSLLSETYASKYLWDFEQFEVKEFVAIVERKFS